MGVRAGRVTAAVAVAVWMMMMVAVVSVMVSGMDGVVYGAASVESSGGTDGADVQPPHDGTIQSPKTQMELGVRPVDVVCMAGLDLVIRTNGLAACITPETRQKMLDRGMLSWVVASDQAGQDSGDASDHGAGEPDGSGSNSGISSDGGGSMGYGQGADSQVRPDGRDDQRIAGVPASGMSVINVYITDPDLNRGPGSSDTVQTAGLLEFVIGGVPIQGPRTMTETGVGTGVFLLRLQLPESVNGRALNQDDIVTIRYTDRSDASGERRVHVKSVPLTNTYAQIQVSAAEDNDGDGVGGGATLVGRELVVRLYEPDANHDSRDEDKIPLGSLKFKADGGIRTTLADPVFDANRPYLVETGPNTGVFEVIIEIPQKIGGRHIYSGDRYEITYTDTTTPSDTDEEVVIKGRIGR